MTRREWLALSALVGADLAMADAAAQSRSTAVSSAPAALDPDDGELVYIGRDPVRIKVSPSERPGRFGMITQDVSPGTSIPVHLHEREDEIIFIQSGSGEAVIGDARTVLSPGSVLFVPQGTWHGGRNTGGLTLKWVAIYSPSGFEGYFREIGRPSLTAPAPALSADDFQALDARYGIRYR